MKSDPVRDASPCGRLREWASIAGFVKKGIRALSGGHRALVVSADRYRCSVNLDEARRDAEPNAARWDYILSLADEVIGMEVHPAKASEVDLVVRKKQWAARRLGEHCDLRSSRWHWIRPKARGSSSRR